MQEIVNGKNKKWELISKISEGDAGEIYCVKVVGTDLIAILKRPTTNPFDAERQLEQLKSEKEILEAMEGEYQRGNAAIKPVKLLDYGNEDRFFIIMEKATGFSLSALYRISKNEISAEDLLEYSQVEQHFAAYIAKTKKVPPYLILRVLFQLLRFLDGIHSLKNLDNDNHGVVWNDVKPDHIFWNPISKQITIIDWGNAQFLNQNGIAQNGNLDANADLLQYIEVMVKYVKMISPELAKRLGWSTSLNPKNMIQTASFLQKSILEELQDYERKIDRYRIKEKEIYQSSSSFSQLNDLIDVHEHILQLGECPDYVTSRKHNSQLINQLSKQQEFEDCKAILDSKTLFYEDYEQQQIVEELIFNVIPRRSIYFSKAIESATREFASPQDWEEVFWNIHLAFVDNIRELRSKDRLLKSLAVKLNKQAESILDSVLYNKLVGLKSKLDRKKTRVNAEKLRVVKKLDTVIDEWRFQKAKDGQFLTFGLGYDDVKEFIGSLLHLGEDDFLKDVNEISQYVVDLEKKVEPVISAWWEKDFLKAKAGLRTLHKWDAERLRVFTAERLLARAVIWIRDIQTNKSKDSESLLDEGKEFRYFFGKAPWLDDEIRRLESILTPTKSILSKKTNREKPQISTPSSGKTLTTIAAPNSNDTTGTHPVIKKPRKKDEPSIVNPIIQDATPEIFFLFLKGHKWEDAKKILEEGCFSEITSKNYLEIVDVFQKIDVLGYPKVDWDTLIEMLEKDISPKNYLREIACSWEVIENFQKKDWKQAKLTHSKVSYKDKINEAIEMLRDFSGIKWKNKLSQVQTNKINLVITGLEDLGQSITEKVLSPYLIFVITKAGEHIENTRQAVDEFNRNKTEKSSFNLLVAIKNLESHFFVDPEKPQKWMREYEDVVTYKKLIMVDEDNPVFDFLKREKYPSQAGFGAFLKSFFITVSVGGAIVILFLFLIFVNNIDGFFGDNEQFSPMELNSFRPTKTPKKEASDTPNLNPPVAISTLLPDVTLTSEASQLALDCDEAKLFVREKRWKEYLEALDLLREEEYESLRSECGWNHDYRQRKLDVSLRNVMSLSSEQVSNAKERLVKNIEEIKWDRTAKYIEKSLDANDLLLRSQRLRGILASCNSASIRVPVNNVGQLVEELTENYFNPEMMDVFRELCQQDSREFLQTKILPQDTSVKSDMNLLSDVLPYDLSIKPCFYNDRSDSNGIHYKGSTDNCLVRTIITKVDFIDFSMCIYEPAKNDAFFYGMKVSQEDMIYSIWFKNENEISYAWLEPGVVIIDPQETFDTSNISCGTKELDVQVIALGNLLMWRYRSGEQFVYVRDAQVLDDEFIKVPYSLSLFGYVKDAPEKELHFYLWKFNVQLGVMP